jgi:hypothetical protein
MMVEQVAQFRTRRSALRQCAFVRAQGASAASAASLFQPMAPGKFLTRSAGVEGKKSFRSIRTMAALPTCGRALETMECPRQKPVAHSMDFQRRPAPAKDLPLDLLELRNRRKDFSNAFAALGDLKFLVLDWDRK